MALRLSRRCSCRRAGAAADGRCGGEPGLSFSADYAVSFFGITVARSTVVSRIGARDYWVDGSIKSAGLATFFGRTTARTAVSGRIDKGRMAPDRYSVDYVYGDKAKKTRAAVRPGQCRQGRQCAAAAAAAGRLGAGRRRANCWRSPIR